MRLEDKNVDERAAEGDVPKGAESETGPPPAEPHQLLSRKGDSLPARASKLSTKGSIAALNEELEAKRAKTEGPSSKEEIMAALGEGVGTADGWSWDVEHVGWDEHEGGDVYYEPGFEPWADQWAAGPGENSYLEEVE